ncbi:hypothetical protein NSA25_10395 [Erysipelatoclostridium ramosum]|uniref:hypothetical protein n=1 Tax=Thomasclavelia ramosa TaxID=1547 RepID=UPI00192C5C2F|nr:hypothetical protein [Thomasclavelia ramosa]MCR1948245.1 hypothetical protein [Thomasclavelia ramosa]QQY28488.1 hypothetical protein I6I63_04575 [Thomasclavelia ramosa]
MTKLFCGIDVAKYNTLLNFQIQHYNRLKIFINDISIGISQLRHINPFIDLIKALKRQYVISDAGGGI